MRASDTDTLTHRFVEQILSIRRDQLSTADLDAVRRLFLDHIGVVANGSTTESAAVSRAMLTELDITSSTELPLIGTDQTAPPLEAAFANGLAGHSIEYDDVHNASSSHPGIVVFPAALAAAALARADEHQFLLGCVVGFEAMCRVGRAVDPAAHYAAHFHPTATIGHFGAAAAAGILLNLGRREMTWAFGIAATMAAGSMEFLRDGAWTKRLHPGHAARDGVEAALLASHGFVGTEDGLGGRRGFLKAYTSAARPDALLADWPDRELEVHSTSIKPHTCCRYMQGPIDALLEIRANAGLEAQDVAGVRIGVPAVAVDIIWEPVARKRHPLTVVDAQFSMPYGAAVALSRGRAALPEFEASTLRDEDLKQIMDVTECVVDRDLDRTYPEQWRAWAEVDTVDGRTLRAEVENPKGDPANPLSADELREKFVTLTDGVYSAVRRVAIMDAVTMLGTDTSLERLITLLPTDLQPSP